jgi:hypothetical protein
MAADLVTLADAIKDQLQTDLGDEAIVERVWEKTLDLSSFEGKRVLIFPNGWSESEPVTRRERFFDLSYTYVVTERYIGDKTDEGFIPESWTDEQVAWVEEQIYNRLSDEKNPYIVSETYWAQNIEVIVAVEFTYLSQQNVFWSEIEIVFRKLKA